MTDGLKDNERAGIRAVLEESPKISRAVLFGSRAMGAFRPASDIDLALEGEGLRLADLVSLSRKIAELGLPVEVDMIIRDRISNPALEGHIKDVGREWYRRPVKAGVERE
ncbi:MAG: nucleotidyltransferase domain-containing protein [Candidatus Hydrogenedentes bacterium]|nr:nucleotidyltransferase domain-containing protein [Candidatus Hydrogenedentota bacterium]